MRKNPPRRGPVKAVGYIDLGGGEVRYSTEGCRWFVAGRRRAAVHLMSHVCGKLKPVVVEEFTNEDADVPYSQEDIAVTLQLGAQHFTLASYDHMVFACAYSSTAPVRAQPPQGLPPPPRPMTPLVEAYAAGYSSAPVPSAVSIGTAAPAQAVVSSASATSGVVTFSSAPATPAATAPSAPAPARSPAAPPPAAAWIAFPSAWAPAPAPPKVKISSAAPVAVSTSSAAPSAAPSEVKRP